MALGCAKRLSLLPTAAYLIAALPGLVRAQALPVIDVHLHTIWWQPGMKEPLTGFVAPQTPDELRRRTIAALTQYNVVKAVGSGDQIAGYAPLLGDRLLPGLLMIGRPSITPDSLRVLHAGGQLAVLAEFAPQYAGLPPNDPSLEPYWALAEELDIPVGIHMGLGPPGAAYVEFSQYRMGLSNPLLLEDVLVRHPKLRVYVMHAGWPMIDDMLGLLHAHPQVYVDIGVIDWALPEAEFHAYLRRLVEAGFARRIMFGSDNMMWSESFGVAIDRVAGAPFLTPDVKRDILCRNAATFLRLPAATCRS